MSALQHIKQMNEEQKGLYKKKMTIKKVSVDRFTHEFNEEGEDSARKSKI